MSSATSSLASLNLLRDAKRQESSALFAQKRALLQEVKSIEDRMKALTSELWELDDRIEGLEEKEQQNTLQQPQQQQQQQQQQQHQSLSSSMSMNETLTDPTTQLTQQAQASNFQHHDDEHDIDDFQQESSHLAASRTSIAAALPPLDFTHVTSARRPRISTNAQNVDDKSGLAALVSPNCPFSTRQITQKLQDVFHIQSFRETQQNVIQATLSGQDVFVIMRTGGGKSLTYQLPAVLERPKVTLVISPLLSLIQDQEDQMNKFLPQSCVSFTSGMGQAVHTQNWERVRDPNGGVAMMLVTPEKVTKSNKLKSELQKLHQQNRLGRIVIDECHCACQWGHDFRPDYARLGILKTQFPTVPVLAVTATASERVRNDCSNILRLQPHYRFFRSTANRPNLIYQVRPKDTGSDVLEDMASFIQQHHATSAGIIYTYSKKDANTVAEELRGRGIVAEAYHSEVSATKKEHIHKSWMRNETQVVVATIAFGLGINKPDVRFVLHHTLSKTLEAYYQESGRAGRDGNKSDCVLYYSPKDVPRMIKMIHGESTEALFKSMARYGQRFGSDPICRATILQSLGEADAQNYAQMLKRYDTTHNDNDGSASLKDVSAHAKTLLQLLFLRQDDNVTMAMLLKDWRAKPDGAPECVQNNPPGKDLPVAECEQLIVQLLVDDYIDVNVKWNRFDSVVYLVCTLKAQSFVMSDHPSLFIRVPQRVAKAKSSRQSTGGSGWISTTASKTKQSAATTKKRRASTSTATRKRSSSKRGKKRKVAKASSAGSKKPRAKKARSFSKKSSASNSQTLDKFLSQPTASTPEVIELDDDSSSSSNVSSVLDCRRVSLPARLKPPPSMAAAKKPPNHPDPLWDDDSEYEFE